MNTFRYIGTPTLRFDSEKCIGCGNCVLVCPHQVFELESTKAHCRNHKGCMECGACALNCPANAIQVRQGVGCAQAILYAWLARIPVLRRIFAPDTCCS